MNLQKLKNHFEKSENGVVFDFKLSEPFSWRGIYSEVAFTLLDEQSTKEDNLYMINKALNKKFTGYKGGEYYYNGSTEVHFESSPRGYTDGGYTKDKINEITGYDYSDQDMKLVEIAFKK